MQRNLVDDLTIRRTVEDKRLEYKAIFKLEQIPDDEIDELIEEVLQSVFDQVKLFNDDFNSFLNDTESEDELQVILRGQLYIEREITGMLKVSLKEPNVILNDRFMFMSKLNLAVALGIIRSEDKKVFEKINSLRNKFAHSLNFKCEEKNYTEIYDSFNGDMKKFRDTYLISKENENDDLLSKIRSLIGLIWLYIRSEHAVLPLELELEKRKQEVYELQEQNRKLKMQLKQLVKKDDSED